MYPIYIPSRKRSQNCWTAKLLQNEGVDFLIVVDDDEIADYEVEFPGRVLGVGGNGIGINGTRNYIKAHSKEKGNIFH